MIQTVLPPCSGDQDPGLILTRSAISYFNILPGDLVCVNTNSLIVENSNKDSRTEWILFSPNWTVGDCLGN